MNIVRQKGCFLKDLINAMPNYVTTGATSGVMMSYIEHFMSYTTRSIERHSNFKT